MFDKVEVSWSNFCFLLCHLYWHFILCSWEVIVIVEATTVWIKICCEVSSVQPQTTIYICGCWGNFLLEHIFNCCGYFFFFFWFLRTLIRLLVSCLRTLRFYWIEFWIWLGCRAGRPFTGFCLSKCMDPSTRVWGFCLPCAYYLYHQPGSKWCFQLQRFPIQWKIAIWISNNVKCHSFHGTGLFDWLSCCICFW